jgi:hypothetical protein
MSKMVLTERGLHYAKELFKDSSQSNFPEFISEGKKPEQASKQMFGLLNSSLKPFFLM